MTPEIDVQPDFGHSFTQLLHYCNFSFCNTTLMVKDSMLI